LGAAKATRSDEAIHHSDYAEVCVKPRISGDGLRWWGVPLDFSA
jgi:putative transposase